MTDVLNDNKRDRDGEPVDAQTGPIPFIDFFLCCYVYIDRSGSDTNNRRLLKATNGSKRGR